MPASTSLRFPNRPELLGLAYQQRTIEIRPDLLIVELPPHQADAASHS
jgi:hypothetical protein